MTPLGSWLRALATKKRFVGKGWREVGCVGWSFSMDNKIDNKIAITHGVFVLSGSVGQGTYSFFHLCFARRLVLYSAASLSRNATFSHAYRLSFSLTQTVHPIPPHCHDNRCFSCSNAHRHIIEPNPSFLLFVLFHPPSPRFFVDA